MNRFSVSIPNEYRGRIFAALASIGLKVETETAESLHAVPASRVVGVCHQCREPAATKDDKNILYCAKHWKEKYHTHSA
jgi:hypothetical protein